MCGIFAFLGDAGVKEKLLAALQVLESSSYDSAGFCISTTNGLAIGKKHGKISEGLASLLSDGAYDRSSVGMCHTRWATHGRPTEDNAHPQVSSVASVGGDTSTGPEVAVVHNGVLTNHLTLKQGLKKLGYKFVSDTDTEVLAHLLHSQKKHMGENASWTDVVAASLSHVEGSFGIALMFSDQPDTIIAACCGATLFVCESEKGDLAIASDRKCLVGMANTAHRVRDGDVFTLTKGKPLKHHVGRFRLADAFPVDDEVVGCVVPGTGSPKRSDYADRSPKRTQAYQREAEAKRKRSGMLLPDGEATPSSPVTIPFSMETADKAGYEHHMLKEIMESPKAMRECLRGRVTPRGDGGHWEIRLGGLEVSLQVGGDFGRSATNLNKMVEEKTVSEAFQNASRIIIVAGGSSVNAALLGEYLIEMFVRIPVEVKCASEFRYSDPVLIEDEILIAISQSGDSVDTLECVKIAKAAGILTFGIVNVPGSPIAQTVHAGIYLNAGAEIGVAATKTFVCQTLALSMLALNLGKARGELSDVQFDRYCAELDQLPGQCDRFLNSTQADVRELAKYYRLASSFLLMGRSFNFPVALEGALKMKEIANLHAEGYSAGEMKHGPIALIDQFMPVVFIAMQEDPIYDKVVANFEEVKARSGEVIVITEEGNHELNKLADFVLHVPRVSGPFQPFVTILPLQLLAYHIAHLRGNEIDRPRNLAKSYNF